MVLTIHVVRQGGHHYYVHDLVPGRAEGGLVAGEEPGVWTGAGAGSLGLAGPVGSWDFAEVLEGRDPSSGRSLRRLQGDRSSAGFDLTFCAPKSVSLLHLLAPGGDERRGRGRTPGGRGRRPRLSGAGGSRGPAHPQGAGGLPVHHRAGGRSIPPPDQPCPRSPSPHPRGGGQRGPGCRRGLVQPGQSAAPRPPHRGPVRVPRPPAIRARRPNGRRLGAPAVRDG